MQYGGNVTRIIGYMKELKRIKPIEFDNAEVLLKAGMMDKEGNATGKGLLFMGEMKSVLAKIQEINRLI